MLTFPWPPPKPTPPTPPTPRPCRWPTTATNATGTGRGVGELARDFGSSWRWSCGFGAVLPTVFGRFEANYCVILSAQDTDRLKRGLQLGFAASSFL